MVCVVFINFKFHITGQPGPDILFYESSLRGVRSVTATVTNPADNTLSLITHLPVPVSFSPTLGRVYSHGVLCEGVVITFTRARHQPDMIANPALNQLNKEMEFLLSPFAPENIVVHQESPFDCNKTERFTPFLIDTLILQGLERSYLDSCRYLMLSPWGKLLRSSTTGMKT